MLLLWFLFLIHVHVVIFIFHVVHVVMFIGDGLFKFNSFFYSPCIYKQPSGTGIQCHEPAYTLGHYILCLNPSRIDFNPILSAKGVVLAVRLGTDA